MSWCCSAGWCRSTGMSMRGSSCVSRGKCCSMCSCTSCGVSGTWCRRVGPAYVACWYIYCSCAFADRNCGSVELVFG